MYYVILKSKEQFSCLIIRCEKLSLVANISKQVLFKIRIKSI